MSDLIERLRAHAALHRGLGVDDDDEQAQWARDLLTAADEIERLTAALQYEQHRAGRQGTHGDGCADWGPEHYECAIRERDELRDSGASEQENDQVRDAPGPEVDEQPDH